MKKRLKWLLLYGFFFGILFICGQSQNVQWKTVNDSVQPASEYLNVVSFNIRGARAYGDSGVHLEKIAEEIEILNPDIVALQEIDYRLPRSRFQNQAVQLARRLNMNYVFAPNISFVIGSYGNAILSKYPIVEYEHRALADPKENRGVLKAVIQLGTVKVDVYTTHLSLDSRSRIRQIHLLLSHIQGSKNPVILLGDFNTLPDDPELAVLRTSLNDPLHMHSIALPTFMSLQYPLQLDYIMFSEPFSFVHALTQPSIVSDHAAVAYLVHFENPLLAISE